MYFILYNEGNTVVDILIGDFAGEKLCWHWDLNQVTHHQSCNFLQVLTQGLSYHRKFDLLAVHAKFGPQQGFAKPNYSKRCLIASTRNRKVEIGHQNQSRNYYGSCIASTSETETKNEGHTQKENNLMQVGPQKLVLQKSFELHSKLDTRQFNLFR